MLYCTPLANRKAAGSGEGGHLPSGYVRPGTDGTRLDGWSFWWVGFLYLIAKKPFSFDCNSEYIFSRAKARSRANADITLQ